MYINGEEINLYNFEYNNVEEYYDIKEKYNQVFNETQLMELAYPPFWYENAYLRIQ